MPDCTRRLGPRLRQLSRRDFGKLVAAGTATLLLPWCSRADYPNPPQAHPRLFWTADRIALAQAAYVANPWQPQQMMDYVALALIHPDQATRDGYAAWLIGQLNDFTITPDQGMRPDASGCDQYRWNQWVPFALDAVFDQMTVADQQAAIAKYGGYVRTIMQQSWGGPGMPASNYFWGNFTWEAAYAIATWYEADNTDIWDFVYNQRWANFLASGDLGAPPEGSGYGQVHFSYPVLPWLGLPSEFATDWFTRVVRLLAYWISPAPIGTDLRLFTYNDVEDNYPGYINGDNYLGDFLTAAQELCPAPEAGYAAAILRRGLPASNYLTTAIQPVMPGDLSGLPLDDDFGVVRMARQSWADDATRIMIQVTTGAGGGHGPHADVGSFHVAKGGLDIVHEWTGYSSADTFQDATDPNGWVDAGEAACHAILCLPTADKPWEGWGPMRFYYQGWPAVLEEVSTAGLYRLTLDLTPIYRSSDARFDRPNITKIHRKYKYDRTADALTITDHVDTTDQGPRRFQVTTLAAPVQTGPATWTWPGCTLTVPADAQVSVVDNGHGGFRLDSVSTTGQLVHRLDFAAS